MNVRKRITEFQPSEPTNVNALIALQRKQQQQGAVQQNREIQAGEQQQLKQLDTQKRQAEAQAAAQTKQTQQQLRQAQAQGREQASDAAIATQQQADIAAKETKKQLERAQQQQLRQAQAAAKLTSGAPSPGTAATSETLQTAQQRVQQQRAQQTRESRQINISSGSQTMSNTMKSLQAYMQLVESQHDLQEEQVMEKAPPGEKYERMVLALKKKYPNQIGRAYAIAWDAYNKEHGKTDESIEEGAMKDIATGAGSTTKKPLSAKDQLSGSEPSTQEIRDTAKRMNRNNSSNAAQNFRDGGKSLGIFKESVEHIMESTLDEIVSRFPMEHKMCQDGWGMDESLYEALCDHYFKEGRIPYKIWHGRLEELRHHVEQCYGQDTGMLVDEGALGAVAGGIAGGMIGKSPSAVVTGANIGDKIQDVASDLLSGDHEHEEQLDEINRRDMLKIGGAATAGALGLGAMMSDPAKDHPVLMNIQRQLEIHKDNPLKAQELQRDYRRAKDSIDLDRGVPTDLLTKYGDEEVREGRGTELEQMVRHAAAHPTEESMYESKFSKLKGKLAKQPGITDPAALAASIGRKKLGQAEMTRRSVAGRERADEAYEDDMEESKPTTAKQRKFAALAEPKDQVTFADKIAGATKGKKKSVKETVEDYTDMTQEEAVQKLKQAGATDFRGRTVGDKSFLQFRSSDGREIKLPIGKGLKGITLSDLNRAMRQLKGVSAPTNEDMQKNPVSESTGVTHYNPKSQGGTRTELLAKYAKSGSAKDAEACRKAGCTQAEMKAARDKHTEKDKRKVSEATKETSTGRIHKAGPGGYGRKFDTDEEGEENAAKKEPVKRGRGRPKKNSDSETGEEKKFDFSAFLKPVKLKDPTGKGLKTTSVTKMKDADKAEKKAEKAEKESTKKSNGKKTVKEDAQIIAWQSQLRSMLSEGVMTPASSSVSGSASPVPHGGGDNEVLSALLTLLANAGMKSKESAGSDIRTHEINVQPQSPDEVQSSLVGDCRQDEVGDMKDLVDRLLGGRQASADGNPEAKLIVPTGDYDYKQEHAMGEEALPQPGTFEEDAVEENIVPVPNPSGAKSVDDAKRLGAMQPAPAASAPTSTSTTPAPVKEDDEQSGGDDIGRLMSKLDSLMNMIAGAEEEADTEDSEEDSEKLDEGYSEWDDTGAQDMGDAVAQASQNAAHAETEADTALGEGYSYLGRKKPLWSMTRGKTRYVVHRSPGGYGAVRISSNGEEEPIFYVDIGGRELGGTFGSVEDAVYQIYNRLIGKPSNMRVEVPDAFLQKGYTQQKGVAEGADVEYVVVIRDEQGKRSIRISALTPTDAKEKAEAQGYKVLKVKDPREANYFREQGVAEGYGSCNECGAMYEGHGDDHVCEDNYELTQRSNPGDHNMSPLSEEDDEQLNEWANTPQNKEDESFETDIDFMTKFISGGLNDIKRNQTVLPSAEVVTKSESANPELSIAQQLRKLAGLN